MSEAAVRLLRDRLSLLEAAIGDAPFAICLYREAAPHRLELVYANGALERLTGWPPDEALAADLQLVRDDDVERIMSGQAVIVASPQARKGGEPSELELIAWPFRRAAERYVMCLGRNAAERRELEQTIIDLSAAVESSADMMLITERNVDDDIGWAIVYANQAFAQETGYALSELAGVSPSVFVRSVDPAVTEQAMRASHRDEDVRVDVPVSRKDGSWFWGSWRARTIARHAARRRRVITIRNIDERTTNAERIASYAERLRQLHVVAASSGRTAQRQIEAILEFGIASFAMETGYVGKIVDGTFMLEHFVVGTRVNPAKNHIGEQIPLAKMALRLAIDVNDVIAVADLRESGETRVDPDVRAYVGAPLIVRGRRYGGIGFVSHQALTRPFTDDQRDLMRLIAALVGSATERGIQDQRLDLLAFHDALTGLPNRSLLEDRLNQTLAAARRSNRKFAVHMLDLDHFKAINDRGGHAEGDNALKLVAKLFASALRESDTLARIGGDEFVVLQPEVEDADDASTLAERFIEVLKEPLAIGSNVYSVGVTIGVALYPRDGADIPTLLRNADRALYAGKDGGRGVVQFAEAAV